MRAPAAIACLLLPAVLSACSAYTAGSSPANRSATAAVEGQCPSVPSWGDYMLTVGGDAGTGISGSYELTADGRTTSVPVAGQVPLRLTLSGGAVAVAVHTMDSSPAALSLRLEQPYTLASAGACSSHAQVLDSSLLVWSVATTSGYAALATTCDAPLLAGVPPPPGLQAWPCAPTHMPSAGTPAP